MSLLSIKLNKDKNKRSSSVIDLEELKQNLTNQIALKGDPKDKSKIYFNIKNANQNSIGTKINNILSGNLELIKEKPQAKIP